MWIIFYSVKMFDIAPIANRYKTTIKILVALLSIPIMIYASEAYLIYYTIIANPNMSAPYISLIVVISALTVVAMLMNIYLVYLIRRNCMLMKFHHYDLVAVQFADSVA
jgi:hypothetical protein